MAMAILQLIEGASVNLYTTPATLLLIISQVFSLFKTSHEDLLEKLKKDFEEGKEINFNDYEKDIEEDEGTEEK